MEKNVTNKIYYQKVVKLPTFSTGKVDVRVLRMENEIIAKGDYIILP